MSLKLSSEALQITPDGVGKVMLIIVVAVFSVAVLVAFEGAAVPMVDLGSLGQAFAQAQRFVRENTWRQRIILA